MVVSYLLFLVPLTDGESILNTIWFGVLLCLFYSCYTLTMLTYYATFSEVCESEKESVYLSNVKSICDVVYYSLGFALIPLFVSFDINIRYIAIMFLPLSVSMLIPFFLLKEDKTEEDENKEPPLTLRKSLVCSFKNKIYIFWLFTASVAAMGLQLFLGGINELFSSTGLNMTVVMASSFAPVPFTLILYNKIVKSRGLGFAYRYSLTIFSLGMLIMYICNINSDALTSMQLTLIALFGGIFVSFALGSFFSITYTVPTHLAQREYDQKGISVSSMYFAVQGLFEGIAAGIATGIILVTLKANDVISLLPLIVILCCAIAFVMSLFFKNELAFLGKENKQEIENGEN